MRYFIYCRKSSEAEDRQVASIESQLSTLQKTFAERPDIEIVRVYEEASSAKAPGRVQFDEMLSQIERNGADGIVAWAPDRLARNSVDGGRIVYMLDRGVIRDLKFSTYTFENNSQGKFMLQIMFGQSKYYSDALSDNVKRGNRSKVEKGWRPNKPPMGYRNDPATRTIKTDPERFKRIRSIFELFLSGHSTSHIWHVAREEWDLRTPRSRKIGGRLIARSYIHKILTNPFYAGVLIWNGKVHAGAHEPAISLDDFERVQALLGRGEKPKPHRREFAFTGMIRCGECGSLVTAEEKTNRHGSQYTYYHCTKRRTDYRCRQAYTQIAHLEAQIECYLDQLCVPERIHQWAVNFRAAHRADEKAAALERQRTLESAQSRTATALGNLTSLRVRDLIADDEFIRERRRLETDQLRIRQQLAALDSTDIAFEPLGPLISFRIRAVEWFRHGDAGTKRLIFKMIGSNPVLTDKRLRLEAKKPFRLLLKNGSQPQLRAARDHIRTLWVKEDPELMEILAGIQELEARFGNRSSDDHRPLRRAA